VNWRILASLAVLAFLAWVGFEIGRAGSDIQVAHGASPGRMDTGRIVGKRIDRKAWSLDFDSVTMSPDGSQLTIAHVRDGRIHRPGKADVLMRADGVTLNQTTNDLWINGPVHLTEEEGPGRTRTFETVGARYNGTTRQLELDHRATITEGNAKVIVANAKVDFRTGEMNLGPIEGTKPGGSGS
jgi:hypothetical protein